MLVPTAVPEKEERKAKGRRVSKPRTNSAPEAASLSTASQAHTSVAMMSQSLRSSVSFLSRAVRQQSPIVRRSFATTPTRRADPVQDLYIRELAAYKPSPRKANDAEGQVQKFSPPAAPQSPEEANISADLKAYESQAVEVEGQGQEAGQPTPVEEDWLEMDEEKPAAH
ncbi:hypothetical protein H112_07738 [Trichophyton rubrum D6]|uniref:Uncharacterized protein n=2 Tax=Trichophyton TaxID=5550 RepID=A0A022VRJ3_TRIRU|nr:hypothetical protein H100_07762 [Trichophyton rubrum MR850]EZF38015.1 hypothetical protein H102_07727 [Trichophyton rubrum CBS 100081]EZF48650.1 hypothetical protein H103_07750 [Trichophyton rubrum CBS 288.86]EZF59336.1 hypothetical protein H104_07699 [Trichophyton rubrum CBS 289.86]EZF69904.1 hypothetical protein H105_07754 [Trichophyton soudanense CBS 452.61]EZF80527.1 hypothetical protein H110_07748 [Trichophyton rubrum MR1448]EZF91219.1 hypothetical protein H113_07808 [Trichophyton rub